MHAVSVMIAYQIDVADGLHMRKIYWLLDRSA